MFVNETLWEFIIHASLMLVFKKQSLKETGKLIEPKLMSHLPAFSCNWYRSDRDAAASFKFIGRFYSF